MCKQRGYQNPWRMVERTICQGCEVRKMVVAASRHILGS